MLVEEAQKILPDADYRPPAAQSDILSAVEQDKPTAILLIDGVFTQSLSVWHKEILYALECGVAVYGASSMGALRAAETAVYGTMGHGAIYEDYRAGRLSDDDEVAVVHATQEFQFRSLSDAMVNIRSTLRAAVQANVIDAQTHDVLVGIAKKKFFADRSYASLLADAVSEGLDPILMDRLAAFIETSAIDQKKLDAISLLEHIRDHGPAAPVPTKVMRSHPFQALYHRDRRVRRESGEVALGAISSYASLHVNDSSRLHEKAIEVGLLDVLGEMLNISPSPDDLAEERRRFCIDRQLKNDESVLDWCRANDLNEDEFSDLIRRLAVRRSLRSWYISRKYLERTTQEFLDELRLSGHYPAIADAAAMQQQCISRNFADPKYYDGNASLKDLIKEHAKATGWLPNVPIETWAFENGFKDTYDVFYELLRAHMARDALRQATSSLLRKLTSEPPQASSDS
jgi:hypothetical protein